MVGFFFFFFFKVRGCDPQLNASVPAWKTHSQCVNRFTAVRPAQLPSPLFITTINNPQPRTHFRSCSRIAGRSERSESGGEEPIPGQNRGDIPNPPRSDQASSTTGEINRVCVCICVSVCVPLCKQQQWVAEAEWPPRHDCESL